MLTKHSQPLRVFATFVALCSACGDSAGRSSGSTGDDASAWSADDGGGTTRKDPDAGFGMEDVGTDAGEIDAAQYEEHDGAVALDERFSANLPEGALQHVIDVSAEPEVRVTKSRCVLFPRPVSSGPPPPAIPDNAVPLATKDGYVFDTSPSGFRPSRLARCRVSEGAVDYLPEPPSGPLPVIMASAGDGGFYATLPVSQVPAFGPYREGALAWSDNYDGRLTFLAAATSRDVVYTLARAGQLPGEAPSLAELPLIVQYSSGGERNWLERIATSALTADEQAARVRVDTYPEAGRMAATSAGSIVFAQGRNLRRNSTVVATGLHVVRRSSDASLVWERTVPLSGGPDQTNAAAVPSDVTAIDATDDAVYLMSPVPPGRVAEDQTHVAVLRGTDGAILLRLQLSFAHSKVIDPDEQVVWSGSGRGTASAITGRANGELCLSVPYRNTYTNGSSPRAPHGDTIVACFDRVGALRWARQYRIAGQTNTYMSTIHEQPDGRLLLADGAGNAFLLNAEDGQVVD